MADKFQFRRDTASAWTSANPVLSQGELGLELGTGKYKIGDGATAWNSLSYGALSGVVGALDFLSTPGTPAAPAAGVSMYAGPVGGRQMPKFIGPAGLDSALQPFLGRNRIGYWNPPGNSTVLPGVDGYAALTTLGTVTARNVGVTDNFSRMRRVGFVSAATAAALAGGRVAVAQVTLGNGLGAGGFHKVCRFGISDAAIVAGARMFVGIDNGAAPTNVEPNTKTNCIGIGHGASDTNLKIFFGGSVAQPAINLGAGFPTTIGIPYEFALFSPPNANGVVRWEVRRLDTWASVSGEISGAAGVVLPASTTLLSYMNAWRCNNATLLAVGLDLVSDYIETDY